MRFTVETSADTRSASRRNRTWTIDADTADDALYTARVNHVRVIGWNGAIGATITDVDGHGPPTDCAHDHDRLMGGWVMRPDGGRDCRACATATHG